MNQTIASVLGAWAWFLQNWAVIALSATCLSLIAFVVLLIAKYVRICLNIFGDEPPKLPVSVLVFPKDSGQEVRFRSLDGTSLRGMHVRVPNRSLAKGTIVFCHEFGGDMYGYAHYARQLTDAGFDIFTFDFRGHGDSSTGGKYRPLQWPSDKEVGDVLGACAHVESVLTGEGNSAEIGIFGVSRGAGASLLAASSDPNIKAIVCDGAFNTETTLIMLMRRWASIFARVKLVYENHPESFWKFMVWMLMLFAQPKLSRRFPSVRRALQEMQPRPIFFIHGRRDSYISEEQTKLLYQEAPTPKYLWIVDRAGHNQSVVTDPKQYAARTIAFFRRHLADEPLADEDITSPTEVGVA